MAARRCKAKAASTGGVVKTRITRVRLRDDPYFTACLRDPKKSGDYLPYAGFRYGKELKGVG